MLLNNNDIDPVQQLDQKLDRLISEYGKEMFAERSKFKLALKRGRRPIEDKSKILEQIERDARCWLDGHDPIKITSNYAVAMAIVRSKSLKSTDSPRRRIVRKLKKDRAGLFVTKAITQAIQDRPLPELQKLIQRALSEKTSVQPIIAALAEQCDKLERLFEDRFDTDIPNFSLKRVTDILSISGSKRGGLRAPITLQQAIDSTNRSPKI